MAGRDVHESHRVSTPLELLFDLTFVVAIAASAAQLHHAASEQHLAQGMLGFATTFFAIWWAWMNFTWFASAYDTDDTAYRLLTMVQLVGVLVLAAGVTQAAQGHFTTVTVGYLVMRVGLVSLWLRASREHPERRQTCRRYAIGIAGVQALWVARLALPPSWGLPSFLVLALLEFAIPMWAEQRGHTPWHAHHIAERYSLFTIIVLGECVLGASNAVASVIQSTGWSFSAVLVGFGSASLVMALWWVYFLVPCGPALHHHRERAFGWGYGHAFVFFSLAALGAFLGVVADQLKAPLVAHGGAGGAGAVADVVAGVAPTATAHPVSATYAIALVAAAVALYLLSVWWMSQAVTRVGARLRGVWLASVVILAAVVVAVAWGLPLPWALPAITLAPLLVIAVVESGTVKRPERYAIR